MCCMIVVNERCGILGGVVLLGLCCCRWGEGVEWRCAGLCTSFLWEKSGRSKIVCVGIVSVF